MQRGDAAHASQRAKYGARLAPDGQARARSEAEAAVHASATALQQLETKLKVARAARTPEGETKAAQQTLTDAARSVQNARSALAAGKYLESRAAVKDTVSEINAQMLAMDEAASARAGKRRR